MTNDSNTDTDTEKFDDLTRGRIKHHAEYDRMAALLWSIDSNISKEIIDNCFEEGIEAALDLVDHYYSHGDFTAVDGIGPVTSESLEAAVPVIEEALGIDRPPEPEPEIVDEESDDDQNLRTCTLGEFGSGGGGDDD